MRLNGLFNSTFSALERSLNRLSRNHQLIASNLANLDTPDYKSFKMAVDETMAPKGRNALDLKQTHGDHLSSRSAAGDPYRIDTVEADSSLMRGDGNTVSLDREMANLAENTLMYNAGIRMTTKQFQLLMDVIKGSK